MVVAAYFSVMSTNELTAWVKHSAAASGTPRSPVKAEPRFSASFIAAASARLTIASPSLM